MIMGSCGGGLLRHAEAHENFFALELQPLPIPLAQFNPFGSRRSTPFAKENPPAADCCEVCESARKSPQCGSATRFSRGLLQC